MQAFDQFRRDLGGVDLFTTDLDLRIGDEVGDVKLVLVAFRAIGTVDIVDQAFIQRPGIHLAFPIVNDRVAETVDFRLLVGNTRLDPGFAGGLQCLFAWRCDQRIDRLVQRLRRGQRILVFRMRDIGVMLDDGSRISGGLCGKRGESRRCGKKRERGAENGFADHDPSPWAGMKRLHAAASEF